MSPQNRSDKKKPTPKKPKVTLGDLFSQQLNQPESTEATESSDSTKSSESTEKGTGVKHTNIADLKDGDFLESIYFCSHKMTAATKAGKAYLNLTIADKSGEVVVRVFDDAERLGEVFNEGDFIYIQGRSQIFQNNMQVIARHVERVSSDDLNPEDYLPASHLDAKKMEKELRRIMDTIEDPQLNELCKLALDDPNIGPRFTKSPAGKSMHHAYMHGLMEHTLSMARLAELVCSHYKNLDRNMILAGIMFHDIGKIYELSFDVAIDYSDAGKLIGHMSLGLMAIEKLVDKIDDFPVEKKRLLEHILLSHHGSRDFGAQMIPATVEANVIHHLDNMDAKVNTYLGTAEKNRTDSQWTERHFLLGTQVRKTVTAPSPFYDFNLPEEED
jgi:3'-5' exoribonuclease